MVDITNLVVKINIIHLAVQGKIQGLVLDFSVLLTCLYIIHQQVNPFSSAFEMNLQSIPFSLFMATISIRYHLPTSALVPPYCPFSA